MEFIIIDGSPQIMEFIPRDDDEFTTSILRHLDTQTLTSWKLCCVNLSAMRSRSLHACVSAKALIPRQFDGSSCRLRNSQHTSWISASWSRHAAGNNVWTLLSSTCNTYNLLESVHTEQFQCESDVKRNWVLLFSMELFTSSQRIFLHSLSQSLCAHALAAYSHKAKAVCYKRYRVSLAARLGTGSNLKFGIFVHQQYCQKELPRILEVSS